MNFAREAQRRARWPVAKQIASGQLGTDCDGKKRAALPRWSSALARALAIGTPVDQFERQGASL